MDIMQTYIKEIGNKALEIKESNAMILFGKEAPKDLIEYCVIIESHNFLMDIDVGMYLAFGDRKYIITAVGDHANYSLSTMGHATVYFDSSEVSKLPGCIHVAGGGYPVIKQGIPIKIMTINNLAGKEKGIE
jgi:PTS system glucitol/sorbitol-specific IIA component